jgi:hypothetical protein
MMKNLLRIVAVVLALAAAGLWLAKGANRGWTKTSITKKTVDDVTGIEGITYEKGFVPGLDFLAGTLFVSVVVAGTSFLFRNKQTDIKLETPT